jgi:hypothetical protein
MIEQFAAGYYGFDNLQEITVSFLGGNAGVEKSSYCKNWLLKGCRLLLVVRG